MLPSKVAATTASNGRRTAPGRGGTVNKQFSGSLGLKLDRCKRDKVMDETHGAG